MQSFFFLHSHHKASSVGIYVRLKLSDDFAFDIQAVLVQYSAGVFLFFSLARSDIISMLSNKKLLRIHLMNWKYSPSLCWWDFKSRFELQLLLLPGVAFMCDKHTKIIIKNVLLMLSKHAGALILHFLITLYKLFLR